MSTKQWLLDNIIEQATKGLKNTNEALQAHQCDQDEQIEELKERVRGLSVFNNVEVVLHDRTSGKYTTMAIAAVRSSNGRTHITIHWP